MFEGLYQVKIDYSLILEVYLFCKIFLILREKVIEEFDCMEELGVIYKVDKFIRWVSFLVVVQKLNGKICVCLVFRDLNKVIQREYYLMKIREEVVVELNDVRVFSVFDVKFGFWYIKFYEVSMQLLIFDNLFGRYQYLRMLFDINLVFEVF